MTNKPEQRRRNERPVRGKTGLFKKHIALKDLKSVKATRHFRTEAIKLEYGNDFAWPNVSSHVKEKELYQIAA